MRRFAIYTGHLLSLIMKSRKLRRSFCVTCKAYKTALEKPVGTMKFPVFKTETQFLLCEAVT